MKMSKLSSHKNIKHIGQGTVIGAEQRPLLIDGFQDNIIEDNSKFGENVWIGSLCVVGKGVIFNDNVILSDGSFVEDNVSIGSNTILVYKCLVCADAAIGNNCVIGGFIGENTTIGNNCRIFGDIVHKHIDPSKDWDAPTSMEKGAVIQNNVFIGFGAKITKPVTINHHAYVLPNTIVSCDVPPFHIVKGVNEIIYYKKWKGDLAVSDFFTDGNK
jgi:acetyltransferase-like isoleucine patch superfamily enzyme